MPAAARLDIVAGDHQTGAAGSELPDPLAVRLLDASNRAVRNQIVNFRVTAGGGSVFAGVGLTNDEGLAHERWTLGSELGVQTLEARAVDSVTGEKLLLATFEATAVDLSSGQGRGSGIVNECSNPAAGWIFCDDFEQNRLDSYFEYDDAGGAFARIGSTGVEGSFGMRTQFGQGSVNAGSLKLAFGRTPDGYFRPADAGTANYREIYWRVYVRNEPGWTGGGGDKLSRATSFATSNWAEAFIAHVWSGGGSDANYLVADPASGTDAQGNLQTTVYNDFDNLRWLSAQRGVTPLFGGQRVGEWHCVEARARLNDAGQANGLFEIWVDGELDSRVLDLNWVGAYDSYGINAVFIENYWNDGSPRSQERYLDNFVVSTQPIGCE
ncbi:MAG: hypothetical protein GEU90_21335 [Gemmatimonas sp.]|nr:hypothetical protein [Gemmatimonas sp.]